MITNDLRCPAKAPVVLRKWQRGKAATTPSLVEVFFWDSQEQASLINRISTTAHQMSVHSDLFVMFSVALFHGALCLAKTNAGSSAVFCDEIDARLFEGARYCGHGILRYPNAAISFRPLHGRNRKASCSCDLGLRPADKSARSTNLRRAKQNA
jgi:hypothetical protein